MTLTCAFRAESRDEAEAAAFAWADAEPNVESAGVLSAEEAKPGIWHVTLALTMRGGETMSLWDAA